MLWQAVSVEIISTSRATIELTLWALEATTTAMVSAALGLIIVVRTASRRVTTKASVTRDGVCSGPTPLLAL